jgi:hypothetical protein
LRCIFALHLAEVPKSDCLAADFKNESESSWASFDPVFDGSLVTGRGSRMAPYDKEEFPEELIFFFKGGSLF